MKPIEALEKIRKYILEGRHGDGTLAPILNWCDDALKENEEKKKNDD